MVGTRHGRRVLAAAGLLLVQTGAALAATTAGPGGAAPGALRVETAGGRLTVALDEAPLEAVLDAVEARSGITMRVHGSVDRVVSDRFRGLPLEAGLRRLLRPLNTAFVYAPLDGRLERVIVYPASRPEGGAGERAAPAPAGPSETADAADPDADAAPLPPATEARLDALADLGDAPPGQSGSADRVAAGREIDALIGDADSAVRRRALEVAETTRLASADRLRDAALGDPDMQVRWAAVAALIATTGRDAAIAAIESGLSSPAAEQRLAAVEALGEQIGGEAGERAARRALADPDAAVRAKATEIIGIIEEDVRLGADGDEVEEDEREAAGQSG